MKKVKDKYLVVGADFAGFPRKEAVVEHLKANGFKVEHLCDYPLKLETKPE